MQVAGGIQTDRIEVIDVLRGFTLLGIILAHFTEQYYAGQAPESHQIYANPLIVDKVVGVFVGALITGKFFMIFSFLFGLSFFIQLNKSDGSAGFLIRFAWRLLILMAIGFVHHLHYRGDILMIYAVLGFGLLASFKLPDRVLLFVALALVFNVPAIFTRISDVITDAKPFWQNVDQKQLETYYNTLKSGTYLEILRANASPAEFTTKLQYQVWSGRLYITLGLFLLGLYAGRTNLFANPPFFKKLIRTSLYMLLGSVGFFLIFFSVLQTLNIKATENLNMLGGLTGFDFFNASLAFLYVGLIVNLFNKERWRKRLMIFNAPGRMGLTTYLLQTLLGTAIFFSWGLGWIGDFGAAMCALFALLAFALEILFSRWWLGKFRYGPVEWLWRSLTYLKIQPMVIRHTTETAPSA